MNRTDDEQPGLDPADAEATQELRPSASGDEVTRRLPAEPVAKPVAPEPRVAEPESIEAAAEPVAAAAEPVAAAAPEPVVEPAAEETAAETPSTDSPTEPITIEPTAGFDEEEPGGEYEPDTGAIHAPGRARRISAAGAIIGLLLGLLGFALVVQLRSNASDPELATARPEDLVRILSDLDARQERLRQEISQLEDSQRQLVSGAQGREAALQEARRRADELGILAGTLPAQGPGLEVKFVPGGDGIPSGTVLDAVEELRGAGGEAMQITGQGGPTVRIVASTYFSDARDGLVVDGAHLAAPYTLLVIGDPQTMQTALNIPGGVVDTVRQRGGNVIVQESEAVRVTALHQVGTPKFAHPVS